MIKTYLLSLLFVLIGLVTANAQGVLDKVTDPKTVTVTTAAAVAADSSATKTYNAPDMADTMRSNGKIYVVVLVLATIFAGIIAYLVRLDVKIGKVEKNI